MKNNKAPGVDNITAEVLKAGGEPMIQMLYTLFQKIWKEEKSPSDWKRMLVTPVLKKGDKMEAANYRAISLLSIPGKVFSRILLDKMEDVTESFISESQYGFRKGRGTTDAIFIARQVIEKAREHKVPLHFNFIDFRAAFDTVWRKALWKMMRKIGISTKIVNIVENLYENTECAVVINGQLTEWFSVEVGVRQGCLLSPTLFNIFLEFVMKELLSLSPSIQFDDNMSVDLRYADDTTLLSTVFEKLKLSTKELERACRKWGVKINGAKCRVISPDDDDIQIDNTPVEKVDTFVFLGSSLPGTQEDVERRIAMASIAFGRLRQSVWSKRDLSYSLKMRLYNALIIPIATYGSEAWTLLEREKRKLETFEMKCLRAIKGVSLIDKIRSQSIRESLNVKHNIIEVVKKRRLKWFGHVIRRPKETSYVSKAYYQSFEKKRPKGRPPKRWYEQIRGDTNLPIGTCQRIANDRSRWQQVVHNMGRARVLRGLSN